MVEHERTSVLKNAPSWLWKFAVFAPIVALLVLLDAAPLLYPEKIPISIKWPMRALIERDPIIADIPPKQILWLIWAAGAFGLFCLIDWFAVLISRILMALLLGLLFVMAYEVFMRYVIEKPTDWALELTIWIAGGMYLTSGVYVLQQRSHIRIFMLYDVVPRWMQRVFDLIATSLLVIFAAAVVYGGFNEAWRKLLRWELYGSQWDPPIPATAKSLILIAVVLMAMQAVSNLICDWSKPKQNHDLLKEVSEEAEALKKSTGVDVDRAPKMESR